MEWLKNNGDRFGLLVIALITIAASGMMIAKSFSFADTFKYAPVVGDARGREVPPTGEKSVNLSQEAIGQDKNWRLPALSGKPEVPLFRSVVLIQKGDQIFDMEKPNGAPLRPPVPNSWLLANNLDYTRTDVLDLDKDGDGFSNIEEYNGVKGVSTDPTDKESHPPLTDKLFVKGREEESYWIVFTGSSGDLYQVGERREGGRIKREFVRPGEKFFGDERFTAESYRKEQRFVESIGANKEVGILTVKDATSGKSLELIEKAEMNLPTYTGVFTYTWKVDVEKKVKKGDLFKIEGDPTDYKLTEILETEAHITPWNKSTDTAAGETVRIESIAKRGTASPPPPERPIQLPPGTVPGVTDPAPVTPVPDPGTTPPTTVPPATVPPATIPPTTVPPATIPPTTVPPTTVPPTTVPPTTVPPTTVPPTTVPPTTVPPTIVPPATVPAPIPGTGIPAPLTPAPSGTVPVTPPIAPAVTPAVPAPVTPVIPAPITPAPVAPVTPAVPGS